jgi:hypothetical protein
VWETWEGCLSSPMLYDLQSGVVELLD